MGRGEALRGLTLLEVMMASAILGGLILAALGLMGQATSTAETDVSQTVAEDQVQNAADTIVQDLKETSPQLCSFFDFAEDGKNQSAIVFPSARDESGKFTYKAKVGSAMVVQPVPVWQSVRVYCYVGDASRDDGYITRFEDFNARSYVNPIKVTSITTTQIKLSDGTTFNRFGTLATKQRRTALSGRFTALVTESTSPIRLSVQGRYRQRGGPLGTEYMSVVLTHEVLSRNRN